MDKMISQFFGLHPYQEDMVDFVQRTPKCGLFLQMGLGKSRIALAAIACSNPPYHVLIIAPKNIARSSWIEEIKKTGLNIRYKSLIVNAKGKLLTKKKRIELYEEAKTAPPTLYFVNRELVVDMVEYFGDQWCFPFLIVDELQSFKNYSSKRFKALKSITPYVVRFIGLTGTPAPNGLMDLWSEIYLMDDGARLGKNITAYRNTYFDPGRMMNGYPIEWKPKHETRVENNYYVIFDAKKEIYKAIEDIVVSLDNHFIQLPDVVYNNIYAYMDSDEMKMYKTLMKDNVLEVDGVPEEITAVNAAVLVAKLAQMASGNLYVDEQHNYVTIHKAKLEQLRYIYDNEPSPLLVAYHFKTDVYAITTEFPDAVVFDGSPEMIQEWNKGNIRMMLIQPASAGFGLNLQEGGHVLIWYTPTWNLEEYLQTNARLYRQGQQNVVTIHHILTKNTVDEKILHALERKDMSQQALLDAVKFSIDNMENEEI